LGSKDRAAPPKRRRHPPFRALLGLATFVNEVSGDLLIWIRCLIRASVLECLRPNGE
jgi:hypothetical protein